MNNKETNDFKGEGKTFKAKIKWYKSPQEQQNQDVQQRVQQVVEKVGLVVVQEIANEPKRKFPISFNQLTRFFLKNRWNEPVKDLMKWLLLIWWRIINQTLLLMII